MFTMFIEPFISSDLTVTGRNWIPGFMMLMLWFDLMTNVFRILQADCAEQQSVPVYREQRLSHWQVSEEEVSLLSLSEMSLRRYEARR